MYNKSGGIIGQWASCEEQGKFLISGSFSQYTHKHRWTGCWMSEAFNNLTSFPGGSDGTVADVRLDSWLNEFSRSRSTRSHNFTICGGGSVTELKKYHWRWFLSPFKLIRKSLLTATPSNLQYSKTPYGYFYELASTLFWKSLCPWLLPPISRK